VPSSWPKPVSSTADAQPLIGYTRGLQARFPNVKVEEDRIFIIDGPVWTSAGMTAGIDPALAMVEKDLGADVARSVAKKPVV
jgi:transcriptional regulator GlxA family with amidase domain